MRSLNFWHKLLYILTVLAALLLFVACILYYTGISFWPLLGILSIITPLIILINALFCIYWLLKRHKIFALPLLVIILSLLVFRAFYKLESVEKKIAQAEISVMSFNARGFNKYEQIDLPDLDEQIIEMVKSYEPDIVCFQEFDHTRAADFDLYPYQYVNYIFPEEGKVVQAILSKYPLTNKGVVNFPDSSNNVIYADIEYRNELIRIYNVHLQSFRIIPSAKTILAEPGEKFFGRIQTAFLKQQEQAQVLQEHRRSSAIKTIVCADLNNTAFSNVYRRVKGDLEDSYLERGTGLGTTFRFFKYPLRIDYILVDPSFDIIEHQNLDLSLSDHQPVLTSIRLQAD